MKKLIELFNKKYGHIYGVIDDSIDNEDVFKAYKIIKTLCADDIEIMELLDRVKLPSPKTASESIDKIDAEHVNGGMTEDDLMKYNIPFDGREVAEIIYDGDIENYEHVELEEGYYFVKILNEPIEPKCLDGANATIVSNDGTIEVTLHLDEETDGKLYTFNSELVGIVKESIGEPPLGVGIWVLQENLNDTHNYISKIEYYNEGNFNLLDKKYIPYMVGKKLKNNAEIFNDMENNKASGYASHAEGIATTASGDASHAEGSTTTASNNCSHAEGGGTIASGSYSHAEGFSTTASGNFSHAEGFSTTASVNFSHAEGDSTEASGEASHAEGSGAIASGDYSHAENYASAEGNNSHAEGYWTYASSANQHVQGKFNIKDTTGTYAHIVGNGTADGARSNAHTLDWNGNGWYQGKLSQDGTPTEDKDLTTKKYVDDKTKILPVKNNYIIFEDAVPSRTEVASDGLGYYIFDSLQNEDMIISAVKYNLNVTFNDGTNDRTMDLIIERSLKDGAFCEKDGFGVQVSYSETNHAIRMILVNANDYTQYSILKATLNCDSYSNLLQDYHIENINYDKIKEVPTALNRIANYKDFTLEGKEYYELYDNLSIWDANKFNERLDENSGVKRNKFFKLPGKDNYTMQINQKDSEGIGFGQHISIDNSKNVHIVADAGADVIIKIYNSTTKELIDTLNYCEADFYMTRILNKGYLNGVTSIFIAFTVKDSTESFYGNTQVNDLIVHYDSSFLVKEEILTKTNTKEYIPTGDYNPATKKYVDEKIASIDTTIDNTLPVNGSLNLTTSKFQTTTLASDIEVILPTVKVYTEIHLFFLGISGTNILDTNVAWNNKPTIEDNKKYEFIYTYVNSEIGWLGKAVVYTV